MPVDQKPVRALVIGTGHIGQQHIQALKKVANCNVAVCDRSAAMAELTADRYLTSDWYTDAAIALEKFSPDVAHICTPVNSHLPLAKLALQRGTHVIVEKPVTENLTDWLSLRETAERSGCWLIEDHNYLFNPPVKRVIRLIASGEFGDVVHVDVQFALNIHGPQSAFSDPHLAHPALKTAGGAIADFLTHLSYLAIQLVGPAQKVRTIWQKRETDSPVPHDEMRAMVESSRGTAQLVFSSHTQPDAFRMMVPGTKMTATINLFENLCHIDKNRGKGAVTALVNSLAAGRNYTMGGLRSLSAKLSASPGGYAGLHNLIAEFYQCLRDGSRCPIALKQIDDTSRLIDALIDTENQI